jgi:hypothetical protein
VKYLKALYDGVKISNGYEEDIKGKMAREKIKVE